MKHFLLLCGLIAFGFGCGSGGSQNSDKQTDGDTFQYPEDWDQLSSKANYEDWEIRWSEDKALAVNKTTNIVRVIFEDYEKEEKEDGMTYKSSEDCTLRSVVGPYVSFKRDTYYEGGAHPSGGSNYLTFDIRKDNSNSKDQTKLNDLFEEESLYRAFMKDKVVKDILKKENASPKTFEELARVNAGCMYDLGDIRYSFAFHHVNNGKVAVRVGLGHGCEAARFNFNQLGLYLDIPESLKSDLSAANTNKTLMDYIDRPE